jgi:hypothetical protein
VDSIISKQDHTEERTSEMEDNIKEILHANNQKEKMSIHEYNKRPNPRFTGWKKELKSKLKAW